ncbi:MAG: PepSY-associated TM helix domain-containing protein [Bacteroidota bacterium]
MKKQKRKKKIVKKVFGWLHLWLGLISGIIVFISMLGASVFVWEEELTNWWYKDYIYVPEVQAEVLSPSTIFEKMNAAYPDQSFTSIQVRDDASKAYLLYTYKKAENPSWTWQSGIEYYNEYFVDPYTGELLGVIDKKKDWITLSRFLHQNLLLRSDVGTQIVGAAALIMIVLALTGLYLWWPKNIKGLKRRLTIKWKAKFKRVNWDVHSVGGFYTYIFLIFFAATGLVWTYKWWSNGIYRLLGNDPKEVFVKHESPTLTGADQTDAINLAFVDALSRRPTWWSVNFRIPAKDSEKGTIYAYIQYKDAQSGWDTSDRYAYHPETGEVEWKLTHEEKLLGEKWRNSNYAMHVGSIYGLPTKIIAFVSAIFFAILPISGFLIWWGRKKRKKKPKRKRSSIPIQKRKKIIRKETSTTT